MELDEKIKHEIALGRAWGKIEEGYRELAGLYGEGSRAAWEEQAGLAQRIRKRAEDRASLLTATERVDKSESKR